MLTEKLLTNRQAELLDTIDRYEQEHDRPPSMQELARIEGVAINAIAGILGRIRKRGYITWEVNAERTIRRLGLVVCGEVG